MGLIDIKVTSKTKAISQTWFKAHALKSTKAQSNDHITKLGVQLLSLIEP